MTAPDTSLTSASAQLRKGETMKKYIDQLPIPETLEEAIRQRDGWVETAAMFSRNEDYYRGLLDQIGHAIGEDCLIADDGSRPGGILRAKLPECVRARLGVGAESQLPADYDGPANLQPEAAS